MSDNLLGGILLAILLLLYLIAVRIKDARELDVFTTSSTGWATVLSTPMM